MFQSGTGLIRFSVSLLLPYLSHHLLCFSFSPFLICKCDSHFLHFPSWISVCCPISVHFPYRNICSLLIHITPLSYSNVHLILQNGYAHGQSFFLLMTSIQLLTYTSSPPQHFLPFPQFPNFLPQMPFSAIVDLFLFFSFQVFAPFLCYLP